MFQIGTICIAMAKLKQFHILIYNMLVCMKKGREREDFIYTYFLLTYKC